MKKIILSLVLMIASCFVDAQTVPQGTMSGKWVLDSVVTKKYDDKNPDKLLGVSIYHYNSSSPVSSLLGMIPYSIILGGNDAQIETKGYRQLCSYRLDDNKMSFFRMDKGEGLQKTGQASSLTPARQIPLLILDKINMSGGKMQGGFVFFYNDTSFHKTVKVEHLCFYSKINL